MTDASTKPCTLCKYSDCEEVRTVDAFRDGKNLLMIDPDDLDCGLCIPECSVDAIYGADNVPIDQLANFALN